MRLTVAQSSSTRRIGTESSRTRAALIDAAEELMIEEGYASVTSRRAAAEAGLKPQLVHYYFRTMGDLFLAIYRRRAQQGLERQTRALESAQPLWALWDDSRDPRGTALTMEFVALANHRKEIRAEIAEAAEQSRTAQLKAFQVVFERYGEGLEGRRGLSPMVCTVLMTSISRFLVIEQESLGISSGHAETVEFVEGLIRSFEGDRQDARSVPAQRNLGTRSGLT